MTQGVPSPVQVPAGLLAMQLAGPNCPTKEEGMAVPGGQPQMGSVGPLPGCAVPASDDKLASAIGIGCEPASGAPASGGREIDASMPASGDLLCDASIPASVGP